MVNQLKIDPNLLVLREATTEEKYKSWEANSLSWAGKLSREDYIERKATNGSSALRNGGIRYWVFVDNKDTIYASVETLKKAVIIKTRDGTNVESAWALASVYTLPAYRGQGVAGSMLRRLSEWLDGEEAGCSFSVLYSDVGDYYSRFGWKTCSSQETHLPVVAISEAVVTTTPLTTEDLIPLCELDVRAVTADISESRLATDTSARLAILPTYTQAQWHFGSEEYLASKLFKNPARIPTIKGAISQDKAVWVYWVHDYRDDKLTILRFGTTSPMNPAGSETIDKLASVLRAAQAEAESWDLKKVVIWNPDEDVLKACKMVLGGQEPKVHERTDGSIPCLRWKQRWKQSTDVIVDWTAIEKYSWC